ncbi:MAG: prepilin-type N-terminal cleavage/methylation domain-containing protein [Parcubacteria group bacterium]|jgi:prepilin-type N-terminal cleavage/methylation domain-containing protein
MIFEKKAQFKKGLTLVEMLVAIAIFGIGMEGFTLLFSRVWRTNSYALEMGQSSMAVSQGLSRTMNYIRGARQADNGSYPIKSADDNDLVIYSDYDKDGITERVHLYKSNQNILMGIRDPTGTIPKTYPAGDQTTAIIANSIVNDEDTPIFYYYNKDYPGDSEDNPMSTPAEISNVRLMKIYLEININPDRAPDNIKMQSFVEIRNLNDYDKIGN